MSIPWNVVNHTGEAADAVVGKVRTKIAKLEGLATHFPDDALHLTVVLGQNAHRKRYTVSLTMAVPSDVLHVEKSDGSLVRALDEAVAALARSLDRLKARYRRDQFWRQHPRRDKLHREKIAFADAPLPEGEGPANGVDLLRAALEQHYDRLLAFVARQVAAYVRDGMLARGELDVRDLVDRSAEAALRHPKLKPEAISVDAWLLGLAFHETRRAVRRLLRENRRDVPLELDVPDGHEPEGTPPAEEDHPLAEVLWEQVQTPDPMEMEFIADPRAADPEHQAEARNLLESIRERIAHWPRVSRDIFEMHFMEGFDAMEIAMVVGVETEQVARTLRVLQARLWDELTQRAWLAAPPDAPADARRAFAERLARVADEVRQERDAALQQSPA